MHKKFVFFLFIFLFIPLTVNADYTVREGAYSASASGGSGGGGTNTNLITFALTELGPEESTQKIYSVDNGGTQTIKRAGVINDELSSDSADINVLDNQGSVVFSGTDVNQDGNSTKLREGMIYVIEIKNTTLSDTLGFSGFVEVY